jgi:hypothetical protein
VAGILILLAAILMPVIHSASVAGERSVAISNTRQVAQAVLIYSSSNDDLIPPQRTTFTSYWMEHVGLVKGGRASVVDPMFRPDLGSHPPDMYRSLAGYALNACLRPERPYQSISDHARTVLVAPVTFWHIENPGEHQYIPYVWLAMTDDITDKWIRDQHPGAEIDNGGVLGSERYFDKGVYAFLDGHIKILSSSEFYRPEPDPCGWKSEVSNLDDGIRPTFAIRSARLTTPQ